MTTQFKKLGTYIGIFLSMSLILVSCFPETEEPEITDVDLRLADAGIQKLYRHVNNMHIDSLLQFTSHRNPNYRYIVAQNLAAQVGSKGAIDSLYVLLKDSNIDVATAAAYAIGQSKNNSAQSPLMKAFVAQDSLRAYDEYNATILEAIGKLGDKNMLQAISTVSTYKLGDKELLLGQIRSIYQFALRGIHTKSGDDLIVDMVTSKAYPREVREIAAHTIMRAKKMNIEPYKNRLLQVYTRDLNPNIRMALAEPLSRIQDKEIQSAYIDHWKTESDYRVLNNAIKGAKNLPYIRVIEPILELLSHENPHVAEAAADHLIEAGNSNDAVIYKNFLTDAMSPIVHNKVNAAILKHLPHFYTRSKVAIHNAIKAKYNKATDIYEKRNLIATMAYDPKGLRTLWDMTAGDRSPLIASGLAESVRRILKHPDLAKIYRGRNLTNFKKEAVDSLTALTSSGDAGALAIIGEIMVDKDLGLASHIGDPSFLKAAADKLKLPEELEAYISLNKAYAEIKGGTYDTKNTYNPKKLDWSIYKTYGDSIKAVIQTEQGTIEVRLLPKEAPITVAQFASLANSQFYKDKRVHRVVRNFVIQDGCPRGDGYGSLDFTMPSELYPARYEDEGYLGMASAGLNTECSQWFITHSPTMHLNGRYTIFGKVIKGMDVVHKITLGDKVKNITITKL